MNTINLAIPQPIACKAMLDTTALQHPVPTLAFKWDVHPAHLQGKILCNKQIQLMPADSNEIDYFVLGSIRYLPGDIMSTLNKDNFKEYFAIHGKHMLQFSCKLPPLEKEIFEQEYLSPFPFWALQLHTPEATLQFILKKGSGELLVSRELNGCEFQ